MEACPAKEPLVSIIVPVYNAQRFVRDCLDSLLNQDLPSFEILCIDDGSTDASVEILAEYAEKHEQIRPIHQENAGVSAARNKGLSLARGKYIAFCDSDDFLMHGILGMTVRYMLEKDADLGFYDELWVPEDVPYEKAQVAAQAEVTVGIDEQIRNTVEVVLMVAKREYLRSCGAAFNTEICYAEDALFMVDVLRHGDPKKILHIYQAGYFHRDNSGSSMNAPKIKRMPRHYHSMRMVAKELKVRLEQPIADKDMERYMRNLLNIVVCNALYDGFFLTDRTPESILKELREDGVYPQPFNRNYLRITSLKETLFRFVRFLFPIPLYYSIVSRLVRVCLKLKKV